MSDLVERLKRRADEMDALSSAAVPTETLTLAWRIEAKAALDKASRDNDAAAAEITSLQKELDTATGYAERLAVELMGKHFPEADTWKPLSGDLIGILTQIDNLTTGLCRRGGRE